MPQRNFKHIRIRSPRMFNPKTFRVITKMSHLDEDDQKKVRQKVPKGKRPHAKYTVGKLKHGKKIKGRSWKLQKIMVPRKRK